MELQKFSQEDYDKWTEFKSANGKALIDQNKNLLLDCIPSIISIVIIFLVPVLQKHI